MEDSGGAAGRGSEPAAPRDRSPGWGGALGGAFQATLAHPHWWAIALAGFLLRGGIVVVVVPIVTLPTVATLTSLASPTIAAVAFGNPPPGMVLTYAVGGVLLAGWAALAAIIATWMDLRLVVAVARDEELDLGERPAGAPLGRAIAVRVAAHAGTLAVAAYAAVRVGVEAYGEILSPGDATVPLVWRIALRAPDAIALLVATWLAGEAIGGLAVRRVALGESAAEALVGGARRLVSPSGLGTLAVTSIGVVVSLLPLWLVVARAWDQTRVLLIDGAPVPLLLGSLMLLVVTWSLGLAVLAVGLALRAVAWTTEAYRARPGRSSSAAAPTSTDA